MAKGSRPLPLPGLREPHHARPPTGQTGRPTLATLPPFGRPTGPMATASLTGHLLAPYWPSGEASHWPKGRPRLAKGTGGGAYGHTGAPAPHFPATYGQRGAAPLTGLPLATHWPQRGGAGAPSPGPPPTGHLRPTWPSEAFGHLLPLPPPADRGLRTGGLPTPTYWPPTGLKAPLAIPALPHFPRLFGERWPPAGEGGFRVQRVPIRCGPCALYPLWGPLPPPTGHLPTLTD